MAHIVCILYKRMYVMHSSLFGGVEGFYQSHFVHSVFFPTLDNQNRSSDNKLNGNFASIAPATHIARLRENGKWSSIWVMIEHPIRDAISNMRRASNKKFNKYVQWFTGIHRYAGFLYCSILLLQAATSSYMCVWLTIKRLKYTFFPLHPLNNYTQFRHRHKHYKKNKNKLCNRWIGKRDYFGIHNFYFLYRLKWMRSISLRRVSYVMPPLECWTWPDGQQRNHSTENIAFFYRLFLVVVWSV